MTYTKLWKEGGTIYLDTEIDSPATQIAGWWFGQPVVYGPYMKERIMLVIKGRMPKTLLEKEFYQKTHVLPQKPKAAAGSHQASDRLSAESAKDETEGMDWKDEVFS